MSLLNHYAKKPEKREKSKTVTVRLPLRLLEDFQTHCKDLNLPVSQAVRVLIEYELTGKKKNENFKPEEKPIPKQEEVQILKKEPVKVPRVGKITNSKRFAVKQWIVDKKQACPLCEGWFNAGTFNLRHAKGVHGTTNEKIFSDENKRVIADRMVAERLSKHD